MLNALSGQAEHNAKFLDELVADWHDGRIKLHCIWKTLNVRKRHSALFAEGDFHQLPARGAHAENIIAILRHLKNDWVLLIVPRWLTRCSQSWNDREWDQFWEDTSIPLPPAAPISWGNIFTQETAESSGRPYRTLAIAPLLRRFPVALLRSKPEQTATPTAARNKRSRS